MRKVHPVHLHNIDATHVMDLKAWLPHKFDYPGGIPRGADSIGIVFVWKSCLTCLCVHVFVCECVHVCTCLCVYSWSCFLSHLVPTRVCELCWPPLLSTPQDAPKSEALELRMSYGMRCYSGPRQTPSHPAKSGQSFVTGVVQVPFAYLCLWQHNYVV